jgi:hypothetical protein
LKIKINYIVYGHRLGSVFRFQSGYDPTTQMKKLAFLTGNDKPQSVKITRGRGGQLQAYWIQQQQQLKSPGYPDSACGSCFVLEQPTAEAVPRPSAGLRNALERPRLRRGQELGREVQPGGAGVAAGRVADPHSFDLDPDPDTAF